MKKRETEIAIIAHGVTEDQFQESLNMALSKHKGATIADMDLPSLRAWVKYIEVEYTPETLRERYALQGVRPTCGECPYYIAPRDKRLRCGDCELMNHVDPRDEVCDSFFTWLESGQVTLEGGKK